MGSEALRPQLAREHQVAHVLTPGDSNIVQPHSKRQLVWRLINNAPWRPRGHSLASMHSGSMASNQRDLRATITALPQL